jgi:hypothetical protein
MPKIPCPAGRKHPNGKAIWHKDKNGTTDDCPVCFAGTTPKLEPATETQKAAGVDTSSASTSASRGGSGAMPEPAIKPAAKQPFLRRLGFGDRQTSPETPLAPPKNPEPTYFVDAPHVKKVANMAYGGVRWVFNLYDNIACTVEAGMKRFTERYPKLVTLSESQSSAIDIDPKLDLWGRLATGVTRLFGAKTADQAHNMIDTADLISGFAGLFLYGGSHIAESWKAGKPFREAKKAAKKAAKDAILAAKRAEVRNEPKGEGGVVPQARLGTPAPS